MACIITYNNKKYTQPEFNEYFKSHFFEFAGDFLGSKADIQGFKAFVNNTKSNVQYQLPQGREIEEFVASEKTIRDLAARMSDRIGIPVRFESDRTKEYKGKLENGTAVINLAYATLDTPIHEILGHPIIRAIKDKQPLDESKVDWYKTSHADFREHQKNSSQLYQNLLKELEYGKGKEVLDRIKRDYQSEKYTLEEQQEEALVELLGLYTAGKLDNVKDGKLISLLKRLLKEMKAFMKQLLGQKEVEIDKLPDNMTLGDIANLLAYSNSKLILPGYEVIYTTQDNQQFKTYQEASNHISQLAKSAEDVDLVDLAVNISIENIDKEIETLQKELDNFKFEIEPFNKFVDVYTNKGRLRQNYWARKKDGTTGWTGGAKETLLEPEYDGFVLDTDRGDGRFITKISDEEAEKLYYAQENKFNITTKASREKYAELETKIHNLKNNSLKGFIEKNKEYEQVKEIIEEWIRVNNIQYNPEEVYSRGQEFVSVLGAYSDFDVNLMMQNLLQHIEDNQKAGGEFIISAFTKPVDRKINHLEGGGGKIKFKIYPQSKDIKWAANADVYSGSVWDASEKVSKDKKSELLGVSYTKYPSLQNVDKVQPNLAAIIDNLAHHHNELGISLTGNNFRLEYDEDIPYSTKKIINSINSILDQKYGKLVKPVIKKAERKQVGYSLVLDFNDGEVSVIKEFKNKEDADKALLEERKKQTQEDINRGYEIKVLPKIVQGIQPTQTAETLKESIWEVKDKNTSIKDNEWAVEPVDADEFGVFTFMGAPIQLGFTSIDKANKWLEKNKPKQKEYTEQALINTKIAKLKEVAKKYPRSLIRSEVRPISSSSNLGFNYDTELPFQKIGSKQDVEGFKKFVNNTNTLQNFEQYFPDYSYLNEEERIVFIKGIESGDLTITCTK